MAHARTAFKPCPFTEHHVAACDILVVTGATIPRISRYCIGNYTLCPVYKAQHSVGANPDEPDSGCTEACGQP